MGRHDDILPDVTPWLFRGFSRYVRRFVRKNFHAVRIADGGAMPEVGDRPTVVYLNHPSWWDPMVGLVLAMHFAPQRQHYALIDAAMLEKYAIFKKLGFIGIDLNSARGARRFIEVGRAIMRTPNATLWITAQGEFSDVRQRPVELRPGVGHLAAAGKGPAFVPLAIEYPFWSQRYPEVLASFGEAMVIEAGTDESAKQWTQTLSDRLESQMDTLSELAVTRDASRFTRLTRGSAGVGGVYDLARRIKARCLGQRFTPEHGIST